MVGLIVSCKQPGTDRVDLRVLLFFIKFLALPIDDFDRVQNYFHF